MFELADEGSDLRQGGLGGLCNLRDAEADQERVDVADCASMATACHYLADVGFVGDRRFAICLRPAMI